MKNKGYSFNIKLTKEIDKDVARARDTKSAITNYSNLQRTPRYEHITVRKVAPYQMYL
jgi:hypothetical protein